MVLQFKNEIRKVINRKYGSIQKYIAAHPELKIKRTGVENALNPYSGANISTIYDICEALNYEIVIRPKTEIILPGEFLIKVDKSAYIDERQLVLSL